MNCQYCNKNINVTGGHTYIPDQLWCNSRRLAELELFVKKCQNMIMCDIKSHQNGFCPTCESKWLIKEKRKNE